MENATIWLNELIAFEGAGLDSEFDTRWAKLGSELRARLDFAKVAIANAKRRGLRERITQVLEHAQPFYVLADGSNSPDFRELEQQAESRTRGDTVPPATLDQAYQDRSQLRSAYVEICRAHPDEVAAVIDKMELHHFIWKQLSVTAKEFLNHERIWRLLPDEDSHNDLFVALLRMRFAFLGWQIHDQPHGGMGSRDQHAGERDWLLKDSGPIGDLAIFEALVLDYLNKDAIDKHVEKLVRSYNSVGVSNLYVVAYYEGADFPAFWDRYLKHVKETPVAGNLLPEKAEPMGSHLAARIRSARLTYNQGGIPLYVYYLAMSVRKPPKTKASASE